MPEPGKSPGTIQVDYPAVGVETFFGYPLQGQYANPNPDLTPGSPGASSVLMQPVQQVIICTVAGVLYPLGDPNALIKSLQINFDKGYVGTTTTSTTSTTTTGPTTTSTSTTTSSSTTTSTSTTTLSTTGPIITPTANTGAITVWIWSTTAGGFEPFGQYAPGATPLNWSPAESDRLWSLGSFMVSAQYSGDGVRIIYS